MPISLYFFLTGWKLACHFMGDPMAQMARCHPSQAQGWTQVRENQDSSGGPT